MKKFSKTVILFISPAIFLALFVVGLFLFGTSQAQAATYYVDVSRPGNTGNGLNWTTAKKGVAATYELASAGDIIEISGGTAGNSKTYNNTNIARTPDPGTVGNPVIIRGCVASGADPLENNYSDYCGGEVIFSATGSNHTFQLADSYITFQNISFKGTVDTKYNMYINGGLSGITFDDIWVKNGDRQMYVNNPTETERKRVPFPLNQLPLIARAEVALHYGFLSR
jgi:hypothetical protein